MVIVFLTFHFLPQNFGKLSFFFWWTCSVLEGQSAKGWKRHDTIMPLMAMKTGPFEWIIGTFYWKWIMLMNFAHCHLSVREGYYYVCLPYLMPYTHHPHWVVDRFVLNNVSRIKKTTFSPAKSGIMKLYIHFGGTRIKQCLDMVMLRDLP